MILTMEYAKLALLCSFLTSVYAVGLNVGGLMPSAFTPFDSKGQMNLGVIPDYAKYLKDNDVDGVLLAGTGSEGPSLSLKERKDLLSAWLSAAKPLGLKVVMQVGGLPMPEVLELARFSEKVRPDALLTLPELYYKPVDEERLVRFVSMVSDAAPTLPVLFYDNPVLSGVNLNTPKFFGLATKSIPNFKGVKTSFLTAANIDASNEVAEDQEIFMASHAIRASACMMGYNSSMSAVTNLFPRQMRDIGQAVWNNDIALAKELQRDLNRKVAVISSISEYVPAVKAAMAIISGIDLGNTRDPLPRLTEEQKTLLVKKLRSIN